MNLHRCGGLHKAEKKLLFYYINPLFSDEVGKIRYFANQFFSLQNVKNQKFGTYIMISIYEIVRKSKKVQIGFVIPFDHTVQCIAHTDPE